MKKSLLMTVSTLMIGTLMLTGCGTEKRKRQHRQQQRPQKLVHPEK